MQLPGQSEHQRRQIREIKVVLRSSERNIISTGRPSSNRDWLGFKRLVVTKGCPPVHIML